MSSLRDMTVGVVLSVLGVGSAQAVLITETWESTITDVNHTAFSVGDTFTWTVAYDDSSLIMHRYGDGANGIAEQGSGDDSVVTTTCAGSAAGAPECDINTVAYTLLADAVFDISAYYDVMTSAGLTGYDQYSQNRSQRLSHRLVGDTIHYIVDDIDFNLGRAITWGGGAPYFTNWQASIIDTDRTSVPEPASIVLMGLGLVALGFSRRRNVKG